MIRNYLVGLLTDALGGVFPFMQDERKLLINTAKEYREGHQPASLKTKLGQSDDNIIVNFTGLIADRATSLLFGDGVEFDLPGEGESESDKWLEKVWELNSKTELLHDISDYGFWGGTPAVQFLPDALEDEGATYPQILPIDPSLLTIKTDPENYKKVMAYHIEYMVIRDNRKRLKIRVIEPVLVDSAVTDQKVPESWLIKDFIESDGGDVTIDNRKFTQEGEDLQWMQVWPPILAWKNLPKAGSPYGRPDATIDIIHLQDKINLVFSNANKVTRLQAHQRIWGRFVKSFKPIDTGPDRILSIDNKDGTLNALEGSGSENITAFGEILREAMFSIARSTDPHAIKDKVGQITNFGLRILYKDGLDKLNTKRALYGSALKEINRRLLILGDQAVTDPGQIKWPNPLPIDETERVAGEKFELDNGITSRQTIREERGRDNETELKRLKADEEKKAQDNANLGAQVLRNFNRGAVK